MSTTTFSTAPGSQLIPGYECVERIGAGGYGEVWKVRAPGGLLKALKLVFGHFDEDRATRELKAIHAMKEVRHPFILSVERVEVVEGRLAIVTELADGSLKERFDECRQNGAQGIPREELLSYLRDAAEALDYLCKSHSLQHLDIKPENLLLVAGRVKVADFGMVKSVQDPSMSQLNSLTPVYAPPEAFDGQPGIFSDQYSLSIVYHEMLTGSLPFSGKTTAQLAAQHIYGRPILIRLPVADQPAIQRALSKDPSQRFPNCRALVEALVASGSADASLPTQISAYDSSVAAPRNTVARQTVQLAPTAAPSEPELRDTPSVRRQRTERTRLNDLAPLNVVTDTPWARPTLYIGIGGTGGRVLGQIRRKLSERFGDRTSIQALQMLYIDTNPKALFEASQRDDLTKLESSQLLALPLQPSQEYREDSRELLGWLNRRWLYNIPRSLQTEGIRPLGRLAYVDHAQQVWDRIRTLLTTACDSNGLTTSAAITGLPFVPASPRVFVIASSTGGTGSGICLDLAFTLRRLLAELNLHDDQLALILAHATDRRANQREIALANTYACLQELRHFYQVPFHDALRLRGLANHGELGLPNTYLVHLGNDLIDAQFQTGVESIADFVFRNSVTKAATFFDAARRDSQTQAATHEPSVRSFGLRTIGTAAASITSGATDDLCRTLVDRWRGMSDALDRFAPLASAATELLRETQKRAAPDDGLLNELAQAHADSCGLSHPGISEAVQGIVRRGVRGDVNRWIRECIERQAGSSTTLSGAKLLETPFAELALAVDPYLQRLTESLAESVTSWFVQIMEQHEARVRGARIAAEWFSEHLRNIRARLLAPLPSIETRLTTLTTQLQPLTSDKLYKLVLREPSPGVEPLENSPEWAVQQFLRLTTDGLLCRAGAQIVAGVLAAVRTMNDQLTDLRRDLAQLSETFQGETSARGTASATPWYDAEPEFARHLHQHLSAILAEAERQIEQEFFGASGELRRATRLDPETRKQLPGALRSVTRTLVNRLQKSQSSAALVASRLGAAHEHPLKIAADAIDSPWFHCGGGVRRLVVLQESQRPDETVAECESAVGGACTVFFDPESQPAVCIEAAEIPLRQLLDEVTEGRTDIQQIADRLHTRIDIEWSR